jgi:hypothetical protein
MSDKPTELTKLETRTDMQKALEPGIREIFEKVQKDPDHARRFYRALVTLGTKLVLEANDDASLTKPAAGFLMQQTAEALGHLFEKQEKDESELKKEVTDSAGATILQLFVQKPGKA